MNFEVLSWQSFKKAPHSYISAPWRSWVLDPGSLTQRLIRAADGDFKVRVISQGMALPRIDEHRALVIPMREWAFIREVELVCCGEVWVRARSVIPFKTLRGEETQLKHLGNKPLGAFLFASRAMKRKNIELARFLATDSTSLGRSSQSDRGYGYARRSVFLLHQKPLLVSEFFLPEMVRRLTSETQKDN